MTQHFENLEETDSSALVAETSVKTVAAYLGERARRNEAPPTPWPHLPPKSHSRSAAAGVPAAECRGEFRVWPPVGGQKAGGKSNGPEPGQGPNMGAGTGDGIGALVAAREASHGSFAETAEVAQAIKGWLRRGPAWSRLTPIQCEALESKATKLARIVCGDPNFPDHWRDDAGYDSLVLERLPQA